MSYVNPQQIVDTQSAQHLANLQQTITSTFANVAANYAAQKKQEQAEIKKRQEENAKIIKGNQGEEDLIRYNYQKYRADNPELNLPEVLPAFIDEYSNIKNALDLGTITDPKEQARLRSELAKLKTLPEQIVNGIKAFSELGVTYKDTYGKMNTQGGIDTTQTDPKALKAVNIFLNNTPGTRNIDISRDKNGNLNVDYIIQETDEKGNPTGEPTRYPQAYFRDLLAGKIEGSIVIVPDKTKTLEETDKLISTKDPLTGKNQYNKNFLVTKRIDRGSYIDTVEVVDVNRVKAQVFNSLSADINAMKPVDLAAYYNNILDPSGKEKISAKDLLDEEKGAELRRRATELYVDRYAKRFDSYENSIAKTQKPQPEKPKGLTVSEKKDISNIENAKIIANDIKRDPRLKFDYESLSNLASEYNLSVFESGTKEQIEDNSFSEIVIKGSGGVQATILKTDTPDDIARKIIRAAVPKLGEKNYKEVFEEIGKLKSGEGVYKYIPKGIENFFE
jgi:hypothetical protein